MRKIRRATAPVRVGEGVKNLQSLVVCIVGFLLQALMRRTWICILTATADGETDLDGLTFTDIPRRKFYPLNNSADCGW